MIDTVLRITLAAIAIGLLAVSAVAQATSRPANDGASPSKPIGRLLEIIDDVTPKKVQDEASLLDAAAALAEGLANVDSKRLEDLAGRLSKLDGIEAGLQAQLRDVDFGLAPDLGDWIGAADEPLILDQSLLDDETRQTLTARAALERRRLESRRKVEIAKPIIKQTERVTATNAALMSAFDHIPAAPASRPSTEGPATGRFAVRLGHAMWLTGDWVGAVRHFAAAEPGSLGPNDRWEWARCHEELGELVEAGALLQAMASDSTIDEFWRSRAARLGAYLAGEAAIQAVLAVKKEM